MEEEAFGAKGPETNWWFLEPASEKTLEQTKKLGTAFGWGEDWYLDGGRVPERAKEVWDFVQLQSQVTQMWADLATAVSAADLDKRADWLKSVIELKQPKTPEATPSPPKPTGGSAPTGAPVATPPAPPGTPAGAPAPKKPSAFGRMKAAEEAPAPGAPSPVSEAAAGAAAAAAPPVAPPEPKKPSPFGKKAAPAAPPTGEAPPSAPPTGEAPPTAPPPPGAPATPAAATPEQLRASLSELADDPNVPISKEDVEQLLRDPNFATNLAEAEASIEADLEAELAAAEAET